MKNNFFLPITDGSTIDLNLKMKQFIDTHQEYLKFDCGGTTNIFYGVFPRAIWHGGRTLNFFYQKKYSEYEIKHYISKLNENGVKLRMVFTNLLLEEHHLEDPYCNMILKAMDNGFGNGIIVASDLLENYIRDTHPDLPLISSITKGAYLDTFIEASKKDYEMIVIYARNNILEYIDSINFDKNKIEILISSGCGYCPIQTAHYIVESYNNLQKRQMKTFECYRSKGAKPPQPSYGDLICFDVNDLSKQGYFNYKIQGRGMPDSKLFLSYRNALFKPEYKDIVSDYFSEYIN